jgi:hypothetical protein
MPKLPLTVTKVERVQLGLVAVTVAFSDGTTGNFLIPPTMATIEAVTFSALAFGQLMDLDVTQSTWAHGTHKRYAPRT